MKTKGLLKLLGAIGLAVVIAIPLTVGCAAPAPAPTPAPTPTPVTERLLHAATNITSSYFVPHAKLAEIGGRETGIQITLVSGGGAIRHLQAVYDGEYHLGGGSSVSHYEMIHGLGHWEDNPLPNRIRILFWYTGNDNQFCVRADSDITGVADLAGKTVFPGFPGTTAYSQTVLALKGAGIEYEEFVGSLTDAITAFKDRRIDAYLKSTAGHALDATHKDIMTVTPIRFIGFTDGQIEKIQAKYPWIGFKEFPAGWFPELPEGQEAVKVVSFANQWTCRDDFPEEIAYKWTKAIIENFDELRAVFAGCAAFEPLEAASREWAPDLYFHPGAIRYYREIGVKIPESTIPPEMK